MPASSSAPTRTITWVERVSPRETWRVGIVATVLEVGVGFGSAFAIFRPSTGSILPWFVWPILFVMGAFTLAMFWVVSRLVQPTVIGLCQGGILPGHWSKSPIRWSDLDPPRRAWYGVEFRFRWNGSLGERRGKCVIDSGQLRAVMAHPACPRWNLSAESRRRLGLDPPFFLP